MPDPGVIPDPKPAPGALAYTKLVNAGFTPQEADAWKQQQTQKLAEGGFKPTEINAYWGEGQPHSEALVQHALGNFQRNQGPEIKDPLTAIAAGWDMSVTGLANNLLHGKPMTPNPGHAVGFIPKLAEAGAQMAGDLPAMITGSLVGGRAGATAGALVPGAGETGGGEVVGGTLGAGFGSGAAPEGARQALIIAYNRGEIHNWNDAWKAVQHGAVQTVKSGIAGAAGSIAGPIGGKFVGKMLGSEAAAAGADLVTNASVAGAVGGGLNGHMPDADDFLTGAIIAIGAHAGTSVAGRFQASDAGRRVAGNLQKLYVRTGIKPWQAVAAAEKDPVLRQEIYAQDVHGDPVAPKHRVLAPDEPEAFKPPPPMVPKAPKQPGVDEEMLGHATSAKALQPIIERLETGGLKNPDAAVSPTGAIGRHQIEPGTARQYGFDPAKLHDPAYNEQAYNTIMTDLLRRYRGDETAAFIGYNAGPKHASEYLAAGPGSRLEAVADKRLRGGVRFEKVDASRDESFLPLETQKYLAKARMIAKGDLKAGAGGEELEGHDGTPSHTAAELDQEGEQTREELTAERRGAASLSAASTWEKATDDELTAELLGNAGEQRDAEWASKSRLNNLGDAYVSELTAFRSADDRLVRAGALDRETEVGNEDDFRRASYGARGIAGHMVKYGGVDAATMSPDGATPSMFKALEMVKEKGGDVQEWQAYMLARRTVEKAKLRVDKDGRPVPDSGIETGFNPFASKEMTSRQSMIDKYEEASRVFTEANNGVLRFLRDTGRISDASYQRMVEANPIYVSMRRLTGDNGAFDGKQGRGVASQLKTMEGGDGQIVKPFRSAVDNTVVAVKSGLRNLATGNLINRLQAEPEAAAFYGLRQVQKAKDPNADDIDEALKAYGFTPDQMEAAREAFGPLVAERLDGNLKANQFAYYNDGVREVWQVDDPVLARAIRGAEGTQMGGMIGEAARVVSRFARAGVTIGTFPLRMGLWHQLNQFIMDPHHPPPVLTLLKGIMPAIKGDEVYQRVLAAGGIVHVSQDITSDQLYVHLSDLQEETGFAGKMWNTVNSGLEAVEAVATRLDAANRIGITKTLEERGIPTLKAAMAARKAGIDYAERGTNQLVNFYAGITPFLRPHLLGMKQGAESLYTPGETSGKTLQRAATTLALAVAGITMVKALNYALNQVMDQYLPDDQKYENLPSWLRYGNLVLPPIAGQRITVRLPANFGVLFGDLPERVLDGAFKQSGFDKMEFANELLKEFMPPLLPPVVQVPTEVVTNHNFFTGRALVPDSMRNLLPEYQYTDYTSQTARDLAHLINPGLRAVGGSGVSPIQLDHLITGWTGQYGQAILATLDVPLTGGDLTNLHDVASNLFVKGILARDPGANLQPISDLYRELDAERAKYNSARKVAKEQALAAGQDPDEVETPEKSDRLQLLESAAGAVRNQRAALHGITADKEMNLDEKRQLAEQTYEDMLHTAQGALKGDE